MTPLVPLALAWLAGLFAAMAWMPDTWPAWPPLVLAVAVPSACAAVPAAIAARRRASGSSPPAHRIAPARLTAGGAMLTCALLGAGRQALARPNLGAGHVAVCNGRGAVALVGRIADEPDRRARGIDYRVAVAKIVSGCGSAGQDNAEEDSPTAHLAMAATRAAARPAHGLVLVRGPRYPPYAYGDTVWVAGEIDAPPVLEGFDYRAYLARQDVFSLVEQPRVVVLGVGGGNPVRRALIGIRDRGRRALAAALPEPEAALATGILLGDDRGLPARVEAAFQATNTTHVIAISGSNIALLVALLGTSLGRLLGRRCAAPVVLLVVALYCVLVGGDAAVVRAAIMGGISVVALGVGRPGHAATALAAAALAMTAWRPAVVHDVGFQLSFAATAGLIAFAGRFGAGLEAWLGRRMPAGRARAAVRLANDAVLVTLAAQLTTWPIIALSMGQVSVVGLAANFAILPAQPAVMGLGGLTAAVGAAWPAAGRVAGAVAWLPLAYTVHVVEAFAGLPYASAPFEPSPALVAAYYAGLGVIARGAGRRWMTGCVAWVSRWPRPTAGTGSDAAGVDTGAAGVVGNDASVMSAAMPAGAAAGIGAATLDPATGASWGADPPVATQPSPRRLTPAVAIAPLAVACALVWSAVRAQADGLLHLYQLDVGQGDAVLVVTPNGRRMLVDGGPDPRAVLDGLGRHLPPWDRRLDVVVLTHPDLDHVGGLPAVLERYDVGWILDPDLPAESPDAAFWAAVRQAEPARVVRAAAGGRIALDPAAGVVADVLWPPEPRLGGRRPPPTTTRWCSGWRTAARPRCSRATSRRRRKRRCSRRGPAWTRRCSRSPITGAPRRPRRRGWRRCSRPWRSSAWARTTVTATRTRGCWSGWARSWSAGRTATARSRR